MNKTGNKTTQKKNIKDEDPPKRILLAEDDKFISRACIDGLRKAGYDVETVEDGVTAFKRIKQNPPDLILLDLMMPQKPGEWVLKKMNEAGLLKKIPVIVLSAKADSANMDNCLELGASDYLIKSNFSMTKLIELVQKYL